MKTKTIRAPILLTVLLIAIFAISASPYQFKTDVNLNQHNLVDVNKVTADSIQIVVYMNIDGTFKVDTIIIDHSAQIASGKKLTFDGASSANYLTFSTDFKFVSYTDFAVHARGGDFKPGVSDSCGLGNATNQWSDLFLASGGVINWNNGDVTATHSSNLLAISGGNTRVDRLEIDGAGNYVDVSTDLQLTAAADILLDPGGGDVDIDAADLWIDAGNYLSVNGSTGTATLILDTDVKLASPFDIQLLPTGDDVLIDGGLTVGSTTEAGDNNLRVEGTVTLGSGTTITNAHDDTVKVTEANTVFTGKVHASSFVGPLTGLADSATTAYNALDVDTSGTKIAAALADRWSASNFQYDTVMSWVGNTGSRRKENVNLTSNFTGIPIPLNRSSSDPTPPTPWVVCVNDSFYMNFTLTGGDTTAATGKDWEILFFKKP